MFGFVWSYNIYLSIMFDLLQNVFLDTTDPKTGFGRLIAFDVAFAIIVNLAFYIVCYYLLIILFHFPKKIVFFVYILIAIMILGYIARLERSKSVYRTYLSKGYSEEDAYLQTIEDIRHAYFTWYFIG